MGYTRESEKPGAGRDAKSWTLACALVVVFAFGADALAQTTPSVPGVLLVTAPMVSPATAWSFYGIATNHTTASWLPATTPEYTALARSLSHNGQLGGGRVHPERLRPCPQQHAIEFHFGLAKGGRGVLT